jgi:hypothetical protein
MRRAGLGLILAVATLVAALAIVAVWADRELLSPSDWSRTSTQLLDRPVVRDALAGYLVDELLKVSGAESTLPQQLRAPLTGLARSATEPLLADALATPAVRAVWQAANYHADELLAALVEGGTSEVQVQNGTVILQLHEVLADLAGRAGVPATLVPQTAAQLTVLHSDKLGVIQDTGRALHGLAILLCVVAAALYGLALLLAGPDRRATLLWCGASLAGAGLAVLIARAIAHDRLVPQLAPDVAVRPVASAVFDVATGLLVDLAGSAILLGLPLIAAAWAAGPSRAATALRRASARSLRRRPWLAHATALLALLVLIIWAPVSAVRSGWVLLFAVVALGAAELLRRSVAREFPAR